jgi:sulfate permease, SulP family
MSNLLDELRPKPVLPDLFAGLTSGILSIIFSISLAVLIFKGDFAPFLPIGIGISLMSLTLLNLIVSLSSSLPQTITGPQGVPAAILSTVAATIAANFVSNEASPQMLPTLLAAIFLATVGTGIFLFALGIFRLGNLIRFIPYPVIGGFLAGIGWLLFRGAISSSAGVALDLETLPVLFQPGTLLRWLPGALFALLLILILRRFKHFLLFPSLLIGAIVGFYLVLWITNTPTATARADGWLLGPFPTHSPWKPLSLETFQQVNGALLRTQMGSLLTVVLFSTIALLLNATGMELAFRRDMDLDHELRMTGVANLLAGFGGGMPGYHSVSRSTLNHRMGANSRFPGLLLAVLSAVILFGGMRLLTYFPKPVLGALLFYLGMTFLVEWLYDGWSRLSRADYVLVVLILVVVAIKGLLPGVGVGVGIAIALFVVNYSRIDVVKHTLTGVNTRSYVERSQQHQVVLDEQGDALQLFHLNGYIFFGTANTLLNRVRSRIESADKIPVKFIVLDFRLVNGLDSSAAMSFTKMKQLAEKHGVVLVLTNLQPKHARLLTQGGCIVPGEAVCQTFPNLDVGLEWCEEQLLGLNRIAPIIKPSLGQQLAGLFTDEAHLSHLLSYLTKQHLEEGAYLFRQGEVAYNMYFIETGQIAILLEHGDGTTIRLRSAGPGTVVGEMGIYTDAPRTASAVAEHPTAVYCLSAQKLTEIQKTEPEVVAALHKFIVLLLIQRLNYDHRKIQALLA